MVHKPLANRMAEGRLVVETARQTKVATHLLAYGSGAGNGMIARRIKEGVIGQLREIHNWSNRPVWPQYTEIPKDRPPVPKGLDWDLWLGPALDRPYHPHYTHTVFRGWYDFGGGSMADMGIYALWPVFAALDLGVPQSAEAWATHTCSIADGVCRTDRNDFAYPIACSIRFKFAARMDRSALDLFWYDGGMKPRLPEEIVAQNAGMGIEGILFIGNQGAIMAGFNGQSPQLYAKGKKEPLFDGEPSPVGRASRPSGQGSRRGRTDSKSVPQKTRGGRSSPWVEAAKGGQPSPGSFLNAASITDTVNLGTVALRAGTKVVFDSADDEDNERCRGEQVSGPRVPEGVGTVARIGFVGAKRSVRFSPATTILRMVPGRVLHAKMTRAASGPAKRNVRLFLGWSIT